MSGIIWIASYPKSGNTWLRAFLTNYLEDGDRPADINRLVGGPIATARSTFDDILGIETSDLRPDELAACRPYVYNQLAEGLTEPLFIKIHDAYNHTPAGDPIFPAEATQGVIYLLRNPLDVAVSYAHHENLPVDDIIERMASDHFAMLADPAHLYRHIPQTLRSWSGHVRSWVDGSRLPLCVVRYEDMVDRPLIAFEKIIRFAGLPLDRERVFKAIEFSSFDRLKEQEEAAGFAEKQATAPSFFRKGSPGSGQKQLSERQLRRIVEDHQTVMTRFDYLIDQDRLSGRTPKGLKLNRVRIGGEHVRSE